MTKEKVIRMNIETGRKRWLILAIVLVGTFMSTLDSSIVNVALPTMAKKLSVGIGTIQWVVTSYLIVISASILIFGRIADLRSKKTIYQYGFIIFSIGSLLCGLTNSIQILILARIIQAIGGAMMMSCSQGIITSVFPPNERGRALGLSGTMVALGTMVGPPLGGIMVDAFSWESIFLINVPIGIIAFIVGAKLLPKDENKSNESFDLKGAFLFVAFIVSLFWSILSAEDLGWGNTAIIIGFVIAVVSIVLFYIFEKKVEHPLLDFSMFHNSLFTISIICGFISFIVIFCTNIIHPFYLQYVLKIDPSHAGILMIIYPLSIAVIAPISGYMSDKIGSEILTLIGLAVTAAGVFSMGFLTQNSSYIDIILRVAVLGIGNGLFQSPNNSIVMSSIPRQKLGIAGSINALVRNLGMVFGIAFSMTLLYNRMSAKLGHTVTSFVAGREDVFIYAMKIVYSTAALICVIGIIITFIRLIKSKREGERKTA